MLVDSHCHLNMLDLTPYQGDLQGVIDAATAADVETLLCIGVDQEHLPEVMACAERFKQVYTTVGIHPSDSEQNVLTAQAIVALASQPKVVAIGETGLDYHYDLSNRKVQQESFCQHIIAAKEMHLPLVIHSRAAREDTIAILKEMDAEKCCGVMHCFTESWDMAKEALDLGFYISISGIVTFNKAYEVKDVASKVPMDRLLIETDAPYLTPVPYRGKPNYPAHVRDVATFIALMRGMPIEAFAHQTSENFYRLFHAVKKPV